MRAVFRLSGMPSDHISRTAQRLVMTLTAQQPNLNENREATRELLNSSSNAPQRYITLDAVRGVAALAVVIVHISMLFGLPHQASSGLAVDLFFILSGFVVEHAYGRHLRRDMTFSRFILVRMIRLYPLYIIGLTTYALFYFARPNVAATEIVPSLMLAFLYLPTPPSLSFDPTFLFPVNPVSWSLFCEFFVNILYALFMVRLNARSLLPIVVVFGVVLVVEKLYLQAAFRWHPQSPVFIFRRRSCQQGSAASILCRVIDCPSGARCNFRFQF
jgi:peptidoglycan/LPS O-acetylase OafA/YrhL